MWSQCQGYTAPRYVTSGSPMSAPFRAGGASKYATQARAPQRRRGRMSAPVDRAEPVLADQRVEQADRDLRLPVAAVAGERGVAAVAHDAQRDRVLLREAVREQRIATQDVVVAAA